MSIVFERDVGFEKVYPLYQQLAEQLLGKRFNKLEEALEQPSYKGKPLSFYFEVKPISIKLENLPTIINEAEIKAIFRDERGVIYHNLPEFSFPVLKARFVKP